MIKEALSVARFRMTSLVASRRFDLNLDPPIVSFTFDDVPKSTLNCGVGILDQFRAKGTFYVCGKLAKENQYFLGLNDLVGLIESGHEIGCHTYGHVMTGRHARTTIADDIRQSHRFFIDELKIRDEMNFSYPHGSIGLWNKPLLARNYRSLRTNFGGINTGTVDLNALMAFKLYTSRISRREVDEILHTTVAKRGWTIFYTHDVSEQPSPVGCDPELFHYALQSTHRSAAQILTINEALERINKTSPLNTLGER